MKTWCLIDKKPFWNYRYLSRYPTNYGVNKFKFLVKALWIFLREFVWNFDSISFVYWPLDFYEIVSINQLILKYCVSKKYNQVIVLKKTRKISNIWQKIVFLSNESKIYSFVEISLFSNDSTHRLINFVVYSSTVASSVSIT